MEYHLKKARVLMIQPGVTLNIDNKIVGAPKQTIAPQIVVAEGIVTVLANGWVKITQDNAVLFVPPNNVISIEVLSNNKFEREGV